MVVAGGEVEDGVGVAPLVEAPVVGVQLEDLLVGPGEVLGLVALVHEVGGQVRPGVERVGDRGVGRDVGREPHVLQLTGGDPASPGEQPRADQATAVEVVALVPAAVGDLEAGRRVDQREQHRPHPDGVIGSVRLHEIPLVHPDPAVGSDWPPYSAVGTASVGEQEGRLGDGTLARR